MTLRAPGAAARLRMLRVFGVSLLFVLCHAAALPASTASAATVTIATDGEKQGGALVELTTAAFNRMGMGVRISYLPWVRVMKKGYAGEYDMLLGAYYTRERARHFAYSEPIGKVELVFAKRAENDISFTSLEALRPYRIGYIRGAAVNSEFDAAAGSYLHVEYVSFYEYNIRKLLAGRIDLLIDKKFMVKKTLREKYPEAVDRIDILSPPLQVFDLLDTFNMGLRHIRADGTLAGIYRRHDLEQGPDSLRAEDIDELD
jgi:polar amino acid transport system substrate-binding protein